MEADVTFWLLDLLLSRRAPEAVRDPTTGRFGMGYSRTYRALVLVFLVFSAGILALGIGTTLGDTQALVTVCLVFGTLTLAMAWAAYDAFLVRLGFSEEGIFRGVAGAAAAFVPWSAVTSVEHSNSWSWFRFRAQGFPTLRVSVYRDGLRTFADFAARGLLQSPAGHAPHLLHEKAGQPAVTR